MDGIAAVLLAAGASRRFGATCKVLADIGGTPLVRRAARTVSESGVADIIVVTGGEHEAIAAALRGVSVRFARNADWATGMGGSIATGVSALGPGVSGAFIVPGDMPFLSVDLLRTLGAEFERSGERAIVYPATRDGDVRNPVLWPRRFFARLKLLGGHTGGRPLLGSVMDQAVGVTVSDESVFSDIDTQDDLRAALDRLRLASPSLAT